MQRLKGQLFGIERLLLVTQAKTVPHIKIRVVVIDLPALSDRYAGTHLDPAKKAFGDSTMIRALGVFGVFIFALINVPI